MQGKRILFIAPSSYPIFGAEANVNAKVVKILSEAGHRVDVVSRSIRRNMSAYYPTSTGDDFFSKASLYPVSMGGTNKMVVLFNHIRACFKLGYFYIGMHWAYFAAKQCEILIKQNQYDCILTKNEPAEVIGLYLCKKYGIKWIPTWNDPYIWEKYPLPYGKGVEARISIFRNRLIKQIGKYADKHIFPSVRLRDYMLKYMTGMKKDDCIIVPHILLSGGQTGRNPEEQQCLKIIHAGELGRERNPETFLQGLKIFVSKNLNAKIEFTFMGTYAREHISYFHDMIERIGVSQYVKTLPPVPYEESIHVISKYDVCLIIEASCEEGIFLPSKVVDYLQCEKRIFTVSPQIGVLHDMHNGRLIDYFADVKKPDEIANAISSMYRDFENDIKAQTKDCSQFEQKTVLKQYESMI